MPALSRRIRGIGSSLWAGVTATFRKNYLASTTQPFLTVGASSVGIDEFASWQARQLRYLLYWAYYENSAYDSVHQWAKTYKKEYSLYRSTRGVYNPFNRLGEFWAAHMMGGTLDPAAGDGRGVPSALPILAENEALRPAIGRLWRDSNWQVNKDVLSRLGAVCGDAPIRVEDDPEKGIVALEVVDPYSLKWCDRDRWGNVKAYIVEEWRLDPDYDPRDPDELAAWQRAVLYREEVFRDGEMVTYATFKDNVAHGWDGHPEAWEEPYGFVPMVLIPHQKVSPCAQWGLSEFHAALPKAREVDDVGSHMHDQIRKAVWPKWLFTGVDPSRMKSTFAAGTPTADAPDPGREEVGAICGPIGATAYPLNYDLQLQFVSIEIQNQLRSLEEDYPELLMDSSRVSGDASAKALREARKKAEAKVHARRAGYDDGLRRAMQMAIAIGGWRGYDGYEGFDLDSYQAGDLDFRIGNRPVFNLDPLDVIEELGALFSAAEVAKRAGYPLEQFLIDAGKTPDQVAAFLAARDREQQANIAVATQLALATAPPPPAATPAPAQGA